tara:strand:- start:351564 stop:352751 length:1188 start_codon:yes stop_codon:yes gene_type:complete
MLTISNQSARHLILRLQGLAAPPNRKLTSDQLHELVCQLGFVQVDSIRWVERAQHMILFARSQHYRPEHLRKEIEHHQRLFENYTHDASVIPSQFFRFWRHRFARDKDRLRKGLTRWQGDGFEKHCGSLQRRIRKHGPVRSRDLKHTSGKNTSEMWQWHDGKTALEFLWRTGKLGIESRDGFQKVYNLSERVVGTDDYEARCTRTEYIDWSCRSAIDRLGFATPAEIAGFWNHVTPAEVNRWLSRQSEDVVQRVAVQNADGSATQGLFARSDIEHLVAETTVMPNRVRVLSPFDPVIRDRKRLERLFNFQYRIEIYVPEAKRKFGYYVFPLLEGDTLIGRIDMRADRVNRTLEIKRLWTENGQSINKTRQQRLEQELSRVARFAGLENVRWLSPP